MKKVFYSLIISAFFCLITSAIEETIQMAGAYKMLSQVFTIGGKDTTFGDIRQLKIFTPDYMMYANVNKTNPDSVSSFGIGPYSISGNRVIENVIYSASAGDISDRLDTFYLNIEKTTRGFKQIIPDLGPSDGRKVILIEEYEKVGSVTETPLDGSWKQIEAYRIKGKDTTSETVTQFKTYYAGHFIWGHTYKDSADKNRTGIGFGTFKYTGNNKIREIVITSTYSVIDGRTFDIDVIMIGKDEYRQSYVTPTETRVEVYKRLKK